MPEPTAGWRVRSADKRKSEEPKEEVASWRRRRSEAKPDAPEEAPAAEPAFVDRSGDWDAARESVSSFSGTGEYEPAAVFQGSPVKMSPEGTQSPVDLEELVPFSQKDTPLNQQYQRDQEVRSYVEDHVPKEELDDLARSLGAAPEGAEHLHFLTQSGVPLKKESVRKLSDAMVLQRIRAEAKQRRDAAEYWRRGPNGARPPWWIVPEDPKTPAEARALASAFTREAEENIWTGRVNSVGAKIAGLIAGPVNLIPNIFGAEGIGDPEKEMVKGNPALKRATELAGQELGTQVTGSAARLAGEVLIAKPVSKFFVGAGATPGVAGALGFGTAGALTTSGSIASRLGTGAEFTVFGLVAPQIKGRFMEAFRAAPKWLQHAAAGELAFLTTSAGMSGATLKPMTLEELKQNAILGLVFEVSGGFRLGQKKPVAPKVDPGLPGLPAGEGPIPESRRLPSGTGGYPQAVQGPDVTVTQQTEAGRYGRRFGPAAPTPIPGEPYQMPPGERPGLPQGPLPTGQFAGDVGQTAEPGVVRGTGRRVIDVQGRTVPEVGGTPPVAYPPTGPVEPMPREAPAPRVIEGERRSVYSGTEASIPFTRDLPQTRFGALFGRNAPQMRPPPPAEPLGLPAGAIRRPSGRPTVEELQSYDRQIRYPERLPSEPGVVAEDVARAGERYRNVPFEAEVEQPPEPSSPVMRKKAGERGAVRIPSKGELRKAINDIGEGSARVIRAGFGSIIGKLNDFGPKSAEVAGRLASVQDSARKIESDIRQFADPALKEAGSRKGDARKAAHHYTTGEEMDGGKWGRNTFGADVESSKSDGAFPGVIRAVRSVIDAAGRMYESMGMKQKTATGERMFRNIPGGRVLPHIFHNMGTRILEGGKGRAGSYRRRVWDALVEYTARASFLKDPSRTLDDWRRIATETYSRDPLEYGSRQAADISRIPAEFVRELADIPAWIEVDGRRIPILETKPFTYVEKLMRAASGRLAFIREFGQDQAGVNEVAKQVEAEGGRGALKQFARAVRLTHGHQMERPSDFRVTLRGTPMSPYDNLVRGLQNVQSALRGGMLVGRAARGASEPLRWGMGLRAARGIYQMASKRSPMVDALNETVRASDPKAPIETVLSFLEKIGARNPAIMDWTVDSRLPIEENLKRFNRVMDRVLLGRQNEEFQEALAATIAHQNVYDWTRRDASGKLTPKSTLGDLHHIRTIMGGDAEQARRMVAGKGTAEEYNRYMTRMPAQIMGGTLRGAEKSYLENHPVAKQLLTFQTYAWTVARHWSNSSAELVKSIDRVVQENGSARSWGELGDSVFMWSKENFGAVAAGFLGKMLYAQVFRGSEERDREWKRFTNDATSFLANNWLQTTVSGPIDPAVRYATGSSEGIVDTVKNTFLPVSMIVNAANAFNGTGPYRNMEVGERWLKYLQNSTTLTKPAALLVLAASSSDTQEMARMAGTRRAFYRWKRDKGLMSGWGSGEAVQEEKAEYAKIMRRVSKLLDDTTALRFSDPGRQSEPEQFQELIGLLADALGTGEVSYRGIADALRARMFLSDMLPGEGQGPNEQERRIQNLEAMFNEMTETDTNRILVHDALIQEVINALNGR